MAPWLHELLGFPNAGRGFELVFWTLTALLGGTLLFRERRSGRHPSENVLAWLLGTGLAAFGVVRLGSAIAGRLYFPPEGLHIPVYGVAMAAGFGLPLAIAIRDARRHPAALSAEDAVDLTFWVIVSGLVGARVLAIALDFPSTVGACVAGGEAGRAACWSLLRFWEGGLVFYGGFVGSMLGGWWWCRKAGVPFWAAADQFVPYMALGHAIGRLGCVAAGCCFGAECGAGFPFGVTYPAGSAVWDAHVGAHGGPTDAMVESLRSAPVHAVQLYEAAFELLMFVVLRRMSRARSRRPLDSAGAVVGVWLVAYGAARFCLEVFRGDVVRGFLVRFEAPSIAGTLGLSAETPLALSTSQAVALAAMAAGALLMASVSRRRPDRTEPE